MYKIGNIPINDIANIEIHLKQLKNSNSLNAKQLLDLANILQTSQNLKEYFNSDIIQKKDFPCLANLFENLYSNSDILKSILSSIIDENTIDDNASSELKKIRNNIRKKEHEINTKLSSFLHSKYIQESIITIRNNRFVIPVKNEYRSEVKGFIHDISTSGSTVFIEPIVIFDINNEINNLKNDENMEIEKILMKLSSLLFNHTDNLLNTSNLIGLIDFIFAKAKYSKEFDYIEPSINNEKFINLIDCYHPLLDKKLSVKNTIELGTNYNSLIITGPNTGGKTVTLKTVGLICLMAMSGLHIPAKSGSSIFVFDKIFADIGDEQSIADSLSTFSSHITNIAYILNNATQNSLVLLDELGSGTDPVEGASLAISILENLNKLEILTIATTHYHEIKNFALVTNGFKNASVEFDFNTLSPTYKLLIGVPGRSNAFIISKKLGIPEKIISRAKDFINDDTTSVEEILNQIYEDKRKIESEKEKIEKNSQEIEFLKSTLQRDSYNLKTQEANIIETAKYKARQILIDTKEEANNIIKELENSKNPNKSNNLRNKLNKKISELSINQNNENPKKTLDISEIKIGLDVKIPSLNQVGTIISNVTKDNTVQIQIGDFKTYFDISKLAISDVKTKKSQISNNKKHDFKVSSISPEINVIGQTVDEACFVIDKYLDDCALHGLSPIRIVHGKGTGALRKGIQQFLKNHPHVKSFRLGTFGEGEDGVTIVELKN